MKKEIDYKSLNELISIGKIVLKIGLAITIGGAIVLAFIILEKLQILSFISILLGILLPLFIGLVIAWLVEPIILKLQKKKLSRVWSTIIVYLSFVLLLLLIISLVVPEFVSQLTGLIKQLPDFLIKAKDFIQNIFDSVQNKNVDLSTVETKLMTQVETFINNLSTNSLTGVINSITSVVTEGFNVAMGILIGFYFSLDFHKVNKGIKGFIPRNKTNEIRLLTGELNVMARSYVTGTLFSSLIVMILTFLGLIVSGISSPLLFALFCGITNIIPYFGPYIGGIPVIIVGFSISPMTGIIALITIVVVQFVESNFINPLVVGKAVDIHPIAIVIGLLVFQYFFGIIGMILATPVIGAFKILFRYFDTKYHLLDYLRPKKDNEGLEI